MSVKLSRRSFLKTGGLLALSSVLVTRDLFAQQTPSRVTTLGFIGLGRMSNSHINACVANPKCRILAVSDVDTARMEYQKNRIDQRYDSKSTKMYRDFRDMLADPEIDAVVIATPDFWHAPMCILAAKAGKAIYCEKPLTFTVWEGQAVIDAVRASGVVFQTGSQQRSDRHFLMAAQLASSGLLGDIRDVYTGFSRRFPRLMNFPAQQIPSTVDWDMWCGPAPVRPFASEMLPIFNPEKPYSFPYGAWRWDVNYGNGMQADWGAHHYDIGMWGLNMDGKGPRYVEVIPDPNPKDPSDHFNIRYVFANKTRMTPSVPSAIAAKAGFSNGVFFVGTEASCGVGRGGKFWVSNPALASARLPEGSRPLPISVSHMDDFLNAVQSGAPTIAPVEVGVSSCDVCLIGNIAHRLSRSLEWDWQKQRFVNDAIADTFLYRENRAPWNRL